MVTTSEKTMFFKTFLRIPILDILKMSKIKNQITFWKRNIHIFASGDFLADFGLKCVSKRFQNNYDRIIIRSLIC
jgi:hypothetical protein